MKTTTLKNIGIFSISLFVAASAVYLYSPVIGSHADSREADINLSINPGIGIRTSLPEVAMNATIGSFVHSSVDVDVVTNSQYGYTLTLEDKDSSSNMTATGISDVVSSEFSGKKTSSELEDNTWGFSLDTADYYKVPVNGSPVALKRTNTIMTTEYETTTVDFGVKVGMNLTAGTYSDIVVFTAYVNGQDGKPDDSTDPDDPGTPTSCTGFFCIKTMQEMTSEICDSATIPSGSATLFDWDGSHEGDYNYVPRTVLTDTRDGKKYLVTKLADKSCWMSQNLALDLDSSVALTSANTDLNSKTSWTPTYSTFTEVPTSSNWPLDNESASSAAYSYHPVASDAYYRNGITKSSTPTDTTNEYLWESAGNYYNWYAATAGSGAYDLYPNIDAEDSICPKGWRLPPKSRERKSYYYLLKTTYRRATATTMLSMPLNFIRSGHYHYDYGTMYEQGDYGVYWASTAYAQKTAHDMYFGDTSYLGTEGMSDKGHGFSIRCVAR